MAELSIFDVCVSFKEHPDYLNLTLFISGCPRACKGCSWHSIKVDAHKFDEEAFTQLLSNYKNKIENVVFLGGDWLGKGLLPFIKIAHSFNFSVCLYSGADSITELDAEVLKNLEWLKLGSWKADLGPLTSPTTNQRFYKLADGKIVDEIKFYGGNDRESF